MSKARQVKMLLDSIAEDMESHQKARLLLADKVETQRNRKELADITTRFVKILFTAEEAENSKG